MTITPFDPASTTVDCVREITPREFRLKYERPGKPLLIQRGAENWKAFKSWSPEYFVSVVQDKVVDLKYNAQGIFDFNQNGSAGPVETLTMPFGEAVKLIEADGPNSVGAHYLPQAIVAKQFPELLKDIEYPQWIGMFCIRSLPRIWFGGTGCISPLHHDFGDQNFFVQIRGRKEFVLFAPENKPLMYLNRSGHLPHICDVNPFRPDHIAFPLFQQAAAFTASIGPADILFVPRYWFHAVRTVETSISINFWWRSLLQILLALPTKDYYTR